MIELPDIVYPFKLKKPKSKNYIPIYKKRKSNYKRKKK